MTLVTLTRKLLFWHELGPSDHFALDKGDVVIVDSEFTRDEFDKFSDGNYALHGDTWLKVLTKLGIAWINVYPR